MNLKLVVSRRSINTLIRFSARFLSTNPYRSALTTPKSNSPYTFPSFQNPNFSVTSHFYRFIQSTAEDLDPEESEEEDATMSEFLSRFVWIMRGKLTEFYTDQDKKTSDAMLLFIVEKVLSKMENGNLEQMVGSDDNLSEDLWKVVWEVSSKVTDDMAKAAKKEKLKSFLQCEEVKELCKFAGEIGIRGDMLRELRFKFAREKMEETEFYKSLEKLKLMSKSVKSELNSVASKSVKSELNSVAENESDSAMREDQKVKYVTLPRRHGKIKYKIYGLDLSDSKWAEVADKINASGQILCPQEPQLIYGECKLVTQKITSLGEEDDFIPLLAQWVELLNPSKIDWFNLLHQIKDKNSNLYLKVAETLLSEKSFEADTKDYVNLIDFLVKNNRLEDAVRIVSKMSENGIVPDLLAQTSMIQLYCEAGMMDKAQAILDSLNNQGFKPNITLYKYMVMGYMKANNSRSCGKLITQMRTMNMKPTREIYMAVLRSYAQNGMYEDAQTTYNAMYFDGFEPDFESCGLMVEAYARYDYKETLEAYTRTGKGKDTQSGKGKGSGVSMTGAKYHFDDMTARGFKHDDWTTSCMMTAYKKDNNLDKAIELLLKLEKEQGFEAGALTYTVLLEWFCRLGLVDEAEQVLTKMAALPETPSHKIHVSLLEMYLSTKTESEKKGRVLEGKKAEKKALEQMAVLEHKKDQLSADDFSRVIDALKDARLTEDCLRFRDLMLACGFIVSDKIATAIKLAQAASLSTRRDLKPTRS